MVRISDLVRGNKPAPASVSDTPLGEVRLSNLADLINPQTKTAPALPLEQPPERPLEKPSEQPPEQTPEQQVSLVSDKHFSPSGKNIYLSAQDYLREVRERLLAGKQISLEQPLRMIEQMIAKPSLIDEMYHLTLPFGHDDDMYIASPANSMIYCFKIGVRMDFTPLKLTEICLAALHHDIGMFLLPEAIIRMNGKLSDSEFAEMRKHTETGRDIFISHDITYPEVARAIYEHHERENGQGYPVGLKGKEICEYAKIIGICDSYEAMTHDRPHKKAAAQYISVLQLAGSKDLLFAPHIVKIFLDEITLYPIGSYVRLNNKSICTVVVTNPGNPLKPTVRIVMDGHGQRMTEERLINLAENTVLTIVAGVSADELPL